MSYRRRIYFTSEQKSEIWDRWQRGESMSSIGRGFDRGSSSIYPLLSRTGGIRPPTRRRSRLALTLVEREVISRGIAALRTIRSIARDLCRPASTVSREVNRNGGYGQYRAADADHQVWVRSCRPKPCKLSLNNHLQRVISNKLTMHWSPEQIAGWLKRNYPREEHNQVSHETIYRSLFVQARGVLKKELMQYLRSKRTIRRSMHASIGFYGSPGFYTGAMYMAEEDKRPLRHFSDDFKRRIVCAVNERTGTIADIAREHDVTTGMLCYRPVVFAAHKKYLTPSTPVYSMHSF